MTEQNLNTEPSNSTKTVLCAVFDPMDYAYDNFGNTLNYMTEEDIKQINDYDNVDDLVSYLVTFIEQS
ncbi:hypothetical protein HWC92_gp18 [Flavobacterium phage vB_FspS_morran9-1]|uniref:Uncharacterized protein n=1 Tax=Flavobacterium phage vB_FspS_morran9-1 TaxID=2686258 RepID=A0A6B9LBU7_9CAUD|nr:hypothetical protein HWC92_gp18 [Flavobacterium phage vB_FspS_morran9-1]QHB39552.1 hypothetical protein morran91_gp018 [Flavobacterium phage vB_FspS_morran9-1]